MILATLIILIVVLLFFAGVISTRGEYSREILYIALDSCSYEIYRDLMSRYSNLTGDLMIPINISDTRISVYREVVLLATNTTDTNILTSILEIIKRESPRHIVVSSYASNFLKKDSLAVEVVSEETIWSYCLYRNTTSLDEIASILWRTDSLKGSIIPQPQQPALATLIITLIGIGAAISATLYSLQKSSEGLIESLKKIFIRLVGFLILPILRIKLSKEGVLDNPMRKELYEYVKSRGCVRFSDLLRDMRIARGTIEWHLYTLIKYGYVNEIVFGRKRYIVDLSDPEKVLEKLVSEDRDVACVWSIISRDKRSLDLGFSENLLAEISSKCEMSQRDAEKIIKTIISLIL